MTRNRDIAKFLGKTETSNTTNARLLASSEAVGLDSAQITTIAEGQGLVSYTTLDSLPVTGLTAGDQAYIQNDRRLYISNGDGWYNVALANATPYWDSEPSASYTITDSVTPLIIVAKAIDSDNSDQNLFHQSTVSDSAAFLVDITRDSSVYTFTPKSQDSVGASATAGDLTDSNTNDFIYTFKWSDGINFVSKAVTINYNFAVAGTRFLNPTDDGTEWGNASVTLFDSYNNGGGTWTANYDANNARWQQDNGNNFDGPWYGQALDVSSDTDYLCVMYFDNYTATFNDRGGGYMLLQRSDATLGSGDASNQAGNYLRYFGSASYNTNGPLAGEGTDTPGLVSATFTNTGLSQGGTSWYAAVRRKDNQLRGWVYWNSAWRLIFDTDGAANANLGYISAFTNVRQTSSPQPRVQLLNAENYDDTLTMS